MINYNFFKIRNLILIFLLLFFCLDFTKNTLYNYNLKFLDIGDERDPYEIFYQDTININNERIEFFEKREFYQSHNLENRHLLRWVFEKNYSKLIQIIDKFSNNIGKKFLTIYSAFVGLLFFSIFLFTSGIVFKINNNFKYSLGYVSIPYLSILLYIFYYKFNAGEIRFSIAETLLLISALYFVLLQKKIYFYLYIFICLISPLVRETGIIISTLYFFHILILDRKVSYKGLLIPILSSIPLIILNYDIILNIFNYGFLFHFGEEGGQITFAYYFSNPSPAFFLSLFYNYFIFIIPILIFYDSNNKFQKFLLFYIILYFFVLTVGTPLVAMSARFMPAILILVYCLVYKKNNY